MACSCGQEDVQDKKSTRAKIVVDVVDNVHISMEKLLHTGADNYVVWDIGDNIVMFCATSKKMW